MTSETSSSVISQTSRARNLVLKKRLADKDRRLADKDAVIVQRQQELSAKEKVITERDEAVLEALARLEEQTTLVEELRRQISYTAPVSGSTAGTEDATTRRQLEASRMLSVIYVLSLNVDLNYRQVLAFVF